MTAPASSRAAMTAELKRVVVPVLRELGYSGTFPHFRRTRGKRVSLLGFQFSSWGGKFCVGVGTFPAGGYERGGEIIPADRVRLRDLVRRTRLGPEDGDGDGWFDFDGGDYATVAEAVIHYIRARR
ncbi:MAG TPA: DUF4304 domain-containing protein [Urbifossiella sp.]|nr:DUF4304 domain-containing protein [Urbifossiella sp.]